MSHDIIGTIIQQVQTAKQITHRHHINTRNSDGENALLAYLKKNIKTPNRIVVPVVERFVNAGASLVASDDNGRTPFILLLNRLRCVPDEESENIIKMLKKNKTAFPKNAISPYMIIYTRMRKCGPLERHAHPLRNILSFMIEKNMFKKEKWPKLVERMLVAVGAKVYDFVVDIIHATDEFGKSFHDDLGKLLTTAINTNADPKFISFLLERGAIVNRLNLYKVAGRQDAPLFIRMTDFIDDWDKNDFLMDYIILALQADRFNQEIFDWLVENGARVDQNIIEELVRRNRKDLIKKLYQHGNKLVVPTNTPKNPAYRFVKRQTDRLNIVEAMATKRMTVRKKRKRSWQQIAQESSKLPRELARQLRQYMN